MAVNALIDVVLPVFGLIAVGYLVAILKIVPEQTGDVLGSFVFTVAVPVLLFRALGTLALPETSPWPIWAVYFAGVAVSWTTGALLVRRVFGRDHRAGVIAGVSSGFSNLVLLGVPLITQALGEEGLVLGFIIVAVHLPIMMTVSVILIDRADRRAGAAGAEEPPLRPREVARRIGGSLAKNPLVMAILAGVLFRLTGLPLEGVPRAIIDQIGATAIPLALLTLGMGLKRYGIRGNVVPAIALTATKLVLMPAVVFVLARHVAGLPPLETAVLTLAAAAPTGVNAYLIASHFGTGHGLASNTITIATAASVVSYVLWLAVLGL